jgi:hypothetical protein
MKRNRLPHKGDSCNKSNVLFHFLTNIVRFNVRIPVIVPALKYTNNAQDSESTDYWNPHWDPLRLMPKEKSSKDTEKTVFRRNGNVVLISTDDGDMK